jgi:hypothetical protein
MPSLLELLGHALYPATVMVGPQFPMKRYKFLIRGELKKIKAPDAAKIVEGSELKPPVGLALLRCGLGVLYTGLYVLGSKYFPVDYAATDDLLVRFES